MFVPAKLLVVALIAIFQVPRTSGQRQWVAPTTTAAEMWNGYTWFWPYAVAASESYRDFFVNAQQITNQLYQQARTTGAFSGRPIPPAPNPPAPNPPAPNPPALG